MVIYLQIYIIQGRLKNYLYRILGVGMHGIMKLGRLKYIL